MTKSALMEFSKGEIIDDDALCHHMEAEPCGRRSRWKFRRLAWVLGGSFHKQVDAVDHDSVLVLVEMHLRCFHYVVQLNFLLPLFPLLNFPSLFLVFPRCLRLWKFERVFTSPRCRSNHICLFQLSNSFFLFLCPFYSLLS